MRAKTVRGITLAIKRHLGWDIPGKQPAGSRVMCKGITGSRLHTWAGLVGYCCKDLHEEHFQVCDPSFLRKTLESCLSMKPPLIYNTLQVVLHNISQEDMEQGQVQYMMHGKDLEKNR